MFIQLTRRNFTIEANLLVPKHPEFIEKSIPQGSGHNEFS